KIARKNLQNAKDLFNSVLNETFSFPVSSHLAGEGKGIRTDRTSASKSHWKLKKFEDCINNVIYPVKVQKKDFLHVGKFPIISQENGFINGYSNDAKKLFRIEKPVIIFGDHTRIFKYVDFDFILGADGVKIIKPKEIVNTKFLYYYLMGSPLKSLGYARHYKELKEINVYYPNDILEQKRIVSKLDELSAETKKLEIIYQKKIDDLAELKKSVLKQTFDC
ncbi:MAG: restriction endonuclease subunit S, partial [Endomicrobium sp.]|nr:restriction endonuclease subunit S [Endomicrobium sp.]